ncbi:MAG TPA: lysophospholipid acyltransferase family protein [Baekduia sp.]|uniref:lysophospholipid acyltransferase family protein n=1 Tax=Baekduia sp. TaxID=2600305 RepID=UPI002D78ABF0|nr:lysophospholipid acyltransferase family protein [Baekduia sp.]HET6508294.1 lysophospholipid acyltransferase family protein [Baekduia sp.]
MIGLGPLNDLRRALDLTARRLRGDYDEDEWGFDPEFAAAAEPLLSFLYDRWWRVTATGAEHVPREGRALLVANHAGVLPWDAAMMATALRRGGIARGGGRVRFLVLDWAFGLPWVAPAIRRAGGVPASPYNALRLLRQDHLVMVFPEGSKGVGKPWSERYRLQRFGRGGFVELALRTGAPIVPVAVVGSEEIYPKLGEIPGLARLLGAPYFPITPTFPLLGPFGAIPLPSRWRIAFGEPIDLSALGPEAADDRATVLEVAEEVRERIQSMVYDNLIERQGAFR